MSFDLARDTRFIIGVVFIIVVIITVILKILGEDWGDIVSIVILIITAVILLSTSLIYKKTLQHNAILFLQKEYRTPEMLDALRQLWDLHDKCMIQKKLNYRYTHDREKIRDELKKEYEKIFKDEEKTLDNLTLYSTPPRYIWKKEIFDNQRRIVSHYFTHLYTLKELNVITEKQIKNYFKKADTIRQICIPLEEKLIEMILKKRGYTDREIESMDLAQDLKNLRDLADIMEDC